MKSTLEICDYSVFCFIGCFSGEQNETQEVRISVKLEFVEIPRACISDQLEETSCYFQICEQLKAVATEKKFQTIEHLAWALNQKFKDLIGSSGSGSLIVHKVRPPIENLKGGVYFKIESQI